MLEDFNFGNGKIVYNDFTIDFNIPFENQRFSLKEDLFQVVFNNYILDIGWYPEMNPKGSFKILVIKNYDWDNPIFVHTTRTLRGLQKSLQSAIHTITEHIKSNS